MPARVIKPRALASKETRFKHHFELAAIPNYLKLSQTMPNDTAPLRDRLHAETAQIQWAELQRFFAQGKVLRVANGVDLIDVAIHFVNDNSAQVAHYIEAETVAQVSDAEASEWYRTQQPLWSVVVAPYVLVQLERHIR